MWKKLKNNEEGVVFITVTMIILAMTILALSILSLDVNQIAITEAETKRVLSDIHAQSALNHYLACQERNSTINYPTQTINNVSYTTSRTTPSLGGANYPGTQKLQIRVSY